MNNLYIWFETPTERREFILKLLEIPCDLVEKGLTECLDLLEAGKKKSPYFNLYRRYYNGVIPISEARKLTKPWDPPVVFQKGFKQIYTQNSYAFRPGNWLVLQFRKTKKAINRYNWVLDQIPQERLGLNVPLPSDFHAKRKLKWAKEVLSQDNVPTLKNLKAVYSELDQVKGEHPKFFHGDAVYVWEQLAFAFKAHGQNKQAEKCLRIQASLQPTKSDAFLNLGVFLTDQGRYESAIAAYQEGLKRTPECEFLNYNLASLAEFLGRDLLAQSALNQALVANPSRGLNLFAKGSQCLEKKQYEVAAKYFVQALELDEGEEWHSLRIDCLVNAGYAKLKLGEIANAIEFLKKAEALEPNVQIHRLLAQCYKERGEQWLSRWHLKQAQQLEEGKGEDEAGLIFELTASQASVAKKWLNEHDCPAAKYIKETGRAPALGERVRFIFVPTSIGTIAYIECNCGAKETLTELGDL